MHPFDRVPMFPALAIGCEYIRWKCCLIHLIPVPAPIPTVFIENEQHELTKPTVQLIGRNQSGANRAAQAKECPEGMSHSLALAFWQRIQIRLRSLDLTGELQFPPN